MLSFCDVPSAWMANNAHLSHTLLDIEDLVTLGREQRMCPYYYSRERVADAELVLMPYNYLLDSAIRPHLNLHFENSVVIFDEAHNVESVCADTASFDLTARDLAQAIQEVQRCIEMCYNPVCTGARVTVDETARPDLQSLRILEAVLLELAKVEYCWRSPHFALHAPAR
jgi:regulator of telomere elongation helicase 1